VIATISEAELLEALASSLHSKGPDEAETALGISDRTGFSYKAVRKALAILAGQGRLRRHTILKETLDGRTTPVIGFTVVPE
jgi:hypothetical protein